MTCSHSKRSQTVYSTIVHVQWAASSSLILPPAQQLHNINILNTSVTSIYSLINSCTLYLFCYTDGTTMDSEGPIVEQHVLKGVVESRRTECCTEAAAAAAAAAAAE
eukprot:14147-Heterococcus_DN1.PRE.2